MPLNHVMTMSFQWMCNFPLNFVLIYVRAQSFLLHQASLWLTGFVCRGEDGSITTLHISPLYFLYCFKQMWTFAPALKLNLLLMCTIHPLILRFFIALCHLMHYTADLCPPLVGHGACVCVCLVSLLMQCKWMCWRRLQSDCPWFLCMWIFFFVMKLEGFFFF